MQLLEWGCEMHQIQMFILCKKKDARMHPVRHYHSFPVPSLELYKGICQYNILRAKGWIPGSVRVESTWFNNHLLERITFTISPSAGFVTLSINQFEYGISEVKLSISTILYNASWFSTTWFSYPYFIDVTGLLDLLIINCKNVKY